MFLSQFFEKLAGKSEFADLHQELLFSYRLY